MKAHRLSSKHKRNGKTKCRKLYENHLEGKRSEFFLTLDKTIIYLKDSKGKSRICYVMIGKKIPEVRVLENDKSFKKGFVVVGILTGNGTVPLVKVLSVTKIN
jgi:hypothetical protein